MIKKSSYVRKSLVYEKTLFRLVKLRYFKGVFGNKDRKVKCVSLKGAEIIR